MFVEVAPDVDALDWIMAWGLIILIPVLAVGLLVEGAKWFHTMLNKYFR